MEPATRRAKLRAGTRAVAGWLFRRGGMKRTLLVPFVLLLVAGFGTSWFLYVSSSRKAVLAVVDELALSSAARAAERIEAFLQGPIDIAEANAALVRAFPDSSARLPEIRRALRFQILARPEVDIASIGFADGEYAEAQRLPDGSVRTGSAGRGTGGALVLERVGESGLPVAEDLRREGYDPRMRPWYGRGLESEGLAWTEPYPIMSTGELTMAAVVAVREGGRVLGVTTADVGLGRIASFLDSVSGVQGARAFILDRADRLIARNAAGQATEQLSLAELPEALDFVSVSAREPGRVSRAVSGGMDYRVVLLPLGARLSLDWRLVLAFPEEAFLSSFRQTDRTSAFILVAMLAASIVLAFWTASRVTDPLRRLGASVATFVPGGAGLFAGATHDLVARADEIGRLATSFSTLAERLDRNFAELESSLAEKEVLLKEVHHRVKNNLQIVSSLARLQAGDAEDPLVAEGLESLQERIQAMAFVHEDVYQSGEFEAVDMGRYLARIAESLCGGRYGFHGGAAACTVSVGAHAEGVRLGLERAIPCGLIANELVSNAVKHAFAGRDEGHVEISLVPEGRFYVLVVADDGIGLPPGSPEDAPPLRPNGSEGIGGSLVSSLVAQLRGCLRFRRASIVAGAGGTRVEVRFPVEAP